MLFVLGIAASLLATFLFPVIQDIVASIAVRYLYWIPFRKRQNLSGKWRCSWDVESAAYPPTVIDDSMVAKQLFNRVYASFEEANATYYLIGAIESDQYVSGTWYDGNRGGYHGTFQLIVNPANHNLEGQWIGFSRSGTVKNGALRWERP